MFFQRRFHDYYPHNRFNHKVRNIIFYHKYHIINEADDIFLGTEYTHYLTSFEDKMYKKFFVYEDDE